MKTVVCSESMEEYFSSLQRDVDIAYDVARRARKKGFDPELDVEIPQASDLAARVEKLLYEWDVEGVASRIRELSKDHNREEVSLLIAKEYSKLSAKSREFAIERAVRLGLAVLTEGILVAPLEGITGVSVDKNNDGTDYLTVYFSGPIRSAGGTGQAMSVLIADVVRRELGLGRYVPTSDEIDRLKEEIPLYKSCQHLQYTPSNDEIDLIARNVPVCINGEATEETKVSGFRNLPRVKSEFVRGGACLVIAEGLCLKAPKIQKHVKRLGIDGWEFIDKFVNLKKKGVEDSGAEIAPNTKYLKDMLVGRPVLAHPSRVGGFRLRYGRTRATGLAALAMNPATMSLLGEFIAIGTQLKIERPGKAGAITPCGVLEGPIALLANGDLVQVNTIAEAKWIKDQLAQIVDVGEVLVPYGEFAENNHLLMPAGYSIEWHREELLDKLKKLPEGWQNPDFEQALQMSRENGVALHPKFNLFWSDVPVPRLLQLREHVLSTGDFKEKVLSIKNDESIKRILEDLGALHKVVDGRLHLDRYAEPLLLGLGIVKRGESLEPRVEVPASETASLDLVSALAGIEIRARAMTRIGARVARPEKARERRMKPPPHGLFPVGPSGGAQRIVNLAAEQGSIKVDLGERQCPNCGSKTFLTMCKCGAHTVSTGNADTQEVPIGLLLESALERLKERRAPEIKGVQGMISRNKTPEVIEKAVLRAKNGIFVFKDGTIRIDATDVPLTHFTPEEVGIDVQMARKLGYVKDSSGKDLESPDQMLELKVQDVIIPDSCVSYLIQISKFIDDLLVKLYGGEAFYKIDRKEDLVGHLVVGLAPHTSGGVLARAVGFTPAHAGYAHPFFHAAKRRNCDGDEDSIILLMDCLLNFSRAFLPEKRGGLMDAPLVLTTKLDPNEIDKEAHNMDVGNRYPLEFYRATQRYAHPKEVESMIDLVSGRIGTVLQYEGMSFTHELKNISDGPTTSAYTSLETMDDKLRAQISLGVKIRAVDEADLVHRIITRHLIPDIQGSLKSFTGQQLRCSKCGAKYRRIPLMGKCYCGHKLTLTVHEAGVSKYLERAKEIGEAFNVPQYTQQRISLLENSIRSLFQSDKIKNPKLDEYL